MPTIIICDDNDNERLRLVDLVTDYVNLHDIFDAHILSFSLPQMVLNHASADIYLLDILMPTTSGLELCQKIHERTETAKIIFCTTSKEFAIEAYNLRVLHYLLKPIEKDRLYCVLNEVLKTVEPIYVNVVTKNGIITLNINDICYVEYHNHFLKYKLRDCSEIVSVATRKPFLIEAQMLAKQQTFIQPHNAFLINTSNVKKYNADSFIMKNNKSVPIAKLKRATIREQYMAILSLIGGKK